MEGPHRATARALAIVVAFGGMVAASAPARAATGANLRPPVYQLDSGSGAHFNDAAPAPSSGQTLGTGSNAYTFTASSTGDLVAYFTGSTAMYDESLTVLVNGVASSVRGLDNHHSQLGQEIDFGHVQAGDSLVFEVNVATTGQTFYSDAAMNGDGVQHVSSRAWGGDGAVPAGTYVGFEDTYGGGDLNYHDETFVFTEIGGGGIGQPGGGIAAPVPEPASAGMLLAGLALLGAAARRRRD